MTDPGSSVPSLLPCVRDGYDSQVQKARTSIRAMPLALWAALGPSSLRADGVEPPVPLDVPASPGTAPPSSNARAAPRVLDRLVATVEKQPLLLSELELEARVALIGAGGLSAARDPLSDEVLAEVLEYVVGQRLAYLEADRLQVFAADEEEVQRSVSAFAGRFESPTRYREFLVKHEATEGHLAAILRRDLRVARFIDSKVKLSARVPEAELRRFYFAHEKDFAKQPYAKVREGIRALLTRERTKSLARAQLEELRVRGDVRRVAPFVQKQVSPSRAADLPTRTDREPADEGTDGEP
jgi:hypothetical protein